MDWLSRRNGLPRTPRSNGMDWAHGNRSPGTVRTHRTDWAAWTVGSHRPDGVDGSDGSDGRDGTHWTDGQHGTDRTHRTDGSDGGDGSHGTDRRHGTDWADGTDRPNRSHGTHGTDGLWTARTYGAECECRHPLWHGHLSDDRAHVVGEPRRDSRALCSDCLVQFQPSGRTDASLPGSHHAL